MVIAIFVGFPRCRSRCLRLTLVNSIQVILPYLETTAGQDGMLGHPRPHRGSSHTAWRNRPADPLNRHTMLRKDWLMVYRLLIRRILPYQRAIRTLEMSNHIPDMRLPLVGLYVLDLRIPPEKIAGYIRRHPQ